MISQLFEKGIRRIEAMSWVSLFLLTALWLGCLAWMRPFTLPDEGRYAGVAWEMLRAGAHGIPLLDGMPFFHKPPLYYWMAEASFSVFGINPWAARLPSLLAACVAALATYAFVRQYRGRLAATISLLVLVTQPFFYGASQFANLDMLVASMITLTTLAGATTVLRVTQGKGWRWFSVATAVWAGLGVLAKGLIGLALPGGILLIWIFMLRRWRGLGALLWPPSIIAFIVVCLPWFWAMQETFSGFFHYFFIYQQFDRFSQATFNNREPFWFYLPVVAGLALPWTFWLGGALRREFWNEREAESYVVRLLMVIWIAVVLAFFSIPSSKLIGYALPVLPPLAVLICEAIVAGSQQKESAHTRRTFRVCLGVASSLCIVAVVIAAINARPNSMPLVKDARAQFRPGDQLVMLHAYAYDLPMALRDSKPAWVVDDWANPQIPLRDNWRKELYDAGQFQPAVMQQNLISAEELRKRICAATPDVTFWVLGEPETDKDQALLRGITPSGISGKRALWRIVPDEALRARYCSSVASSG